MIERTSTAASPSQDSGEPVEHIPTDKILSMTTDGRLEYIDAVPVLVDLPKDRFDAPLPNELQRKIDRPIDEADKSWLSSLSGKEISEEDLRAINILVNADVPHLGYEKNEIVEQTAREMREIFYEEALGWNDTEHPQHKTYKAMTAANPNRTPLATFIGTQRILQEYGFDGARFIQYDTSLTYAAPETVHHRIENLKEQGLPFKRIIDQMPSIIGSVASETVNSNLTTLESAGVKREKVKAGTLTISSDQLSERVANLQAQGLNVEKINNRWSLVLHYEVDEINRRIETLNHFGFDTVKISDKLPSLLVQSEDNLGEVLATLEGLGLDVVKAVDRKGTILSQRPDVIQERFKFIQDIFGSKATKIVADAPGILERTQDSILRKMERMEGLGLDAKRVVELQATMLGIDAEEGLEDRVENLKALGFDIETINKQPNLLSNAPETLREKVELLDMALKIAGSKVGAAELITKNPRLLTNGIPKIEAAIDLIAGGAIDIPDTASAIISFIGKPAELQFIAATEDRPMKRADIDRLSKEIPTKQAREQLALRRLRDKSTRDRLSAVAVHSYMRYKEITDEDLK